MRYNPYETLFKTISIKHAVSLTMSYQQFLFFDWLILCPGNLILHQKKRNENDKNRNLRLKTKTTAKITNMPKKHVEI